jgi:hypothetical protein
MMILGSCCILFIFNIFDIIYAVEIENNTKSVEPLTNKGISDFISPYTIHNEDETIFIIEKTKEYGLFDFLVYNKYMKINLPAIEMLIAEYAIINSSLIIFT